MKYFLCVFTIIVINSTPISSIENKTVAPIETKSPAIPVTPIIPIKSTGCDCMRNKVKLYRLYHPTSYDHFYTTSLPEANNAANNLGYVREGSPGLVFPNTANCLCNDQYVPVYRLYKSGQINDHFYTTNVAEAVNAAQNLQYKWEGIAYYCAAKQGDCGPCGSKLPFHRFNRNIDHFYTTSLEVIPYASTYEGILCYIWA